VTTESGPSSASAYAPTSPYRPCASVELTEGRWSLHITLRDEGGDVTERFVASADSGLTQGSGLWFGTEADYLAAL
jgi:hypothetical protein